MKTLRWIARHWYLWLTLVCAVIATATHDTTHALWWAWSCVGWTIALAIESWSKRMSEELVKHYGDLAARWREQCLRSVATTTKYEALCKKLQGDVEPPQ